MVCISQGCCFSRVPEDNGHPHTSQQLAASTHTPPAPRHSPSLQPFTQGWPGHPSIFPAAPASSPVPSRPVHCGPFPHVHPAHTHWPLSACTPSDVAEKEQCDVLSLPARGHQNPAAQQKDTLTCREKEAHTSPAAARPGEGPLLPTSPAPLSCPGSGSAVGWLPPG